MVVAHFGLVVVLGDTGQAVVAEGVVIAEVEIAVGVGLAQRHLAPGGALPEQALQACLDALVHGGAGIRFTDDL
ncbi:hypothetical protein D3C71_1692170 [compost metagenome]